MTLKKICLILIVLYLIGINFGIYNLNADSTHNFILSSDIKQGTHSIQAYIPRSPIWIRNDHELNSSFPGAGTRDDPVRIEGFEITDSSTLISISGTTLYFCISNNLLTGSSTFNRGIYLQNVIHSTVVNNTVSACGNGIEFYSSSNNIITNNTVFNNLYNGIKIVTSSNNNSITENTVYDSDLENGIWVHGSRNNYIANNIVHGSDDDGIRLLGNSNYNIVVNNTSFDNSWVGIRIGHSSGLYNIISRNIIYGNFEEGIKIEGPSSPNNNEVTENIIFDNRLSGILIFSSSFTDISRNIIYNNNENGIQISTSNKSIISNNLVSNNKNKGITIGIFSNNNLVSNNDLKGNEKGNSYNNGVNSSYMNNYWDDLAGTEVYTVDGLRECVDNSPLGNPFHISKPVLTSPTTRELTQTIFISWNKSVDGFNHSLSYEILYSEDSQTSWIVLSSNLMNTTYIWDTSTFYNGTEIFLKIQVIDSLGFVSVSVSANSFFIINPDLLKPEEAPSFSFLVVLLALCSLLLTRQRFRKK